MRFLLSAALTVVLMTGTEAAEQELSTALGLGVASCGSWTASRRDRQAFGYEQWVLGFLAGVAEGYRAGTDTHSLNPLVGVDAEGVFA